MRVFVTGASGCIGSAVVPELIGAGHQVVGLARSDAVGRRARGAPAPRCTAARSTTSTACARGAAAADGVIHLAFKHDFSRTTSGAADADRGAIEAFGAALAGSDRPLVIASGHRSGSRRRGWHRARTGPTAVGRRRTASPSEEAALALAARGVRSSVVRLAADGPRRGRPRLRRRR